MSSGEKGQSVNLNELMQKLNFNMDVGGVQASLKHPAVVKVQSLSKLEINDGVQQQAKEKMLTEPTRAQSANGIHRRLAISRKNPTRAKSQVCARPSDDDESTDESPFDYFSKPREPSSISPALKKTKH